MDFLFTLKTKTKIVTILVPKFPIPENITILLSRFMHDHDVCLLFIRNDPEYRLLVHHSYIIPQHASLTLPPMNQNMMPQRWKSILLAS